MPASRCLLGLSLVAGLAVGAGAPAVASPKDCTGYDSLKANPAVESGKVMGGDKTYFVKSEMDSKACPADTAACRRKGFLVPGNSVLVSGHTGDFVCATYVNAKGIETNGWLPKSAVATDAPGADPKPQDWAGTWIRQEAKVTIKADAKGVLTIHGDATFGAEDPDRVKRGGVNVGEISGTVSPKGGKLAFAMGDNDKTEPVDKGDDSVCKVWMQRLGDVLLVDDNNACGGMNVSFRGTYAKKK